MTFLADACALIVFLGSADPNRDMPAGASIMRHETVGVLATTVWEITRKARAGRLPPLWELSNSLSKVLAEQHFEAHPITWTDAEAASELPDHHRDPMDRILIATALRAGKTIITCDRIFERYGVSTAW